MKKFFNSIKNKLGKAFATVKATVESTTGEGYIDTGVKIIIGVVVGGVILAGLYALFKTTILPSLGTKIGEMFNYAGCSRNRTEGMFRHPPHTSRKGEKPCI